MISIRDINQSKTLVRMTIYEKQTLMNAIDKKLVKHL